MGSFSVDGLASGINTSGMIEAIMAAERLPQQDLKDKVSSFQKVVTALQGINTKTAAVSTAAADILKTNFWSTVTAKSSAASVTANASALSPAQQIKFDVKSVAQNHVEVLDMNFDDKATQGKVEGFTSPPPVLNVTGSANVDPNQVAQAINSGSKDYTASVVNLGNGSYKLMVTSAKGGANPFQVSVNVDGQPSATSKTMQQGQNAEIVFGAGTAQEFSVTSATNTFTGLATGLDVTVTKPETGVTIDVAKDSQSITDKVKGLVDSLNSVLGEIGTKTAASVTEAGRGPLMGSSLMRGLRMELTNTASGYAGTGAAYEAGIQVDRYGKFTFDATKFKELLASDPAKAQSVVADIATKLQTVSDTYSKSSTGIISTAITSKQGQIKGLNEQVDNWDRRLELRQASLKSQFSAMESLMSGLKGQSSWLGQQVSAMNA